MSKSKEHAATMLRRLQFRTMSGAKRNRDWSRMVERAERTWILLHPDLDVKQRRDARDFLDGEMTVMPDMATRRLLRTHIKAAQTAHADHCRELRKRLDAMPQPGPPSVKSAAIDMKRAERDTRLRRLRAEQGLCTRCGAPVDLSLPKRKGRPSKGRMCEKCREKARNLSRRSRMRPVKAG